MVLDEGQVLDGKYVIVRVLATGSMGEVYLGRNERIGKEVAVKVLRRDFADDRAIGNRFEQEARIATAVKSAHVVDVYDLGDLPSGERFIVMEYVEGESLGTRMGREGKLSAHALGGITLQILDGLIAAHAAGVIHRDLKPDNVILSKRDGHELVKLVDFGISKKAEPASASGGPRRDLKRATLDGMLLGTPTYMSPEQARGEVDAVDHRTDIFSLGVSMYEALSGEIPFNGDNVVALLSQIMEQPETPLEKHVPNVDPGLARIIKKAMAKDPRDRYQTAAEMREAVADWYSVFGSTSAMRSSLEGVARTAPPMAPVDILTLPYVGIAIDRKRARAAAAGAAIAAMFVALVARHPAQEPAPAAEPAPVAISTVITVPTTPAIEFPPPPPLPPPSVTPPEPVVVVPVVKKVVATPPPAPVARALPKAAAKIADAGAPAVRDAAAAPAAPKIEEPVPSASVTANETPLPDPPAIP